MAVPPPPSLRRIRFAVLTGSAQLIHAIFRVSPISITHVDVCFIRLSHSFWMAD